MPIYFVDEGSKKACTLSEGSSQEPQLSCGEDPAVAISIEENASGTTVHVGTETIALPNGWKTKNYFIARSIKSSASRFRVLDESAPEVKEWTGSQLGWGTLAVNFHVGGDITPKSISVAPPPVLRQPETVPMLPDSCKNLTDASTGADFKRCQTDKAAAIKNNGGVPPTRTIPTDPEPTEPSPSGDASTAIPVGGDASVLYNFTPWVRAGVYGSFDYVVSDNPYWAGYIAGRGELEIPSIGLGYAAAAGLSIIDGSVNGRFTPIEIFWRIPKIHVALQAALQVDTDRNLYAFGGVGYHVELGGGPDVDTANISQKNHDKAQKIVQWAETLASHTSLLLAKIEGMDPWNPQRAALIDQVKQNIGTLQQRQRALSAWKPVVTLIDDASLNESVSEIERWLKELTDPVKTAQATHKAFEAGLKGLYSLASSTPEDSQPGTPQQKLEAAIDDVGGQAMVIRSAVTNGKEKVREILAVVDSLIAQGQFILDREASLSSNSETSGMLERVKAVMNLLPGLRNMIKLHLDAPDPTVPTPKPELAPPSDPTGRPLPAPEAPKTTPTSDGSAVKPAEPGVTPNPERLAGIERTIKEFDRAWKHIVFSLGIAVSPQRANENDLNQLGTAIQGIKDKNRITEPNEGLQAKIGPQLDKIDEAIKLLDAAQKEFPGNKDIEGMYQRALRIQELLKRVPGLLAARVTKIEEEAAASRAEAARAAQAEAETQRVALGRAQAAVQAAAGEITAQLRGIASSILKDDKIPATPDYIFSVESDLTRKIVSYENTDELDEIQGKILAARGSIESQKATIDGSARTYPSDPIISGQAKLPENALSLLDRLEKKIKDRRATLERKATDTAAATARNDRTEANSLASGMKTRVTSYREELDIKPDVELTDALLDEAFERKFSKAKENDLKGLTTGLSGALTDFSENKLKRLAALQASGDSVIGAAVTKAGQAYNHLQAIHSAAERRLRVIAAEAAPEAVTTDTSDLGRDIRTVVQALRNNHLSKTTGDNNPVTTAIQFQQGIPTKKNELEKRLQPILNSLKSPEVGKAIQGIVVVTSDPGAIGNIKAIFTEAGVAERALVVKLDASLTQQTTNAPDKEFIYVHFFTAHGNISVNSAKTGPGTTALLAETKRLHNEWFPQAEELPELEIKPGEPDIAPPEDPKGAEPATKKMAPEILAAIASDPDFGKVKHSVLKPVERYQDPKAKLEQALVAKFGQGIIPFFTGLQATTSGGTMGIPHVDTLLKIVQTHVPDAEGILVLVHESTPGNSAVGDLQPNGTFVKIAKSYFERDFKKSPLKLDVLGVGRIVLGEKQERTTRYQVVIVRRGTDMGAVKTFIQDFANKKSFQMDGNPGSPGH